MEQRQKWLCNHKQLETTFPENRKPLNCNTDVKFCISLKTSFSKLIRNHLLLIICICEIAVS